MAKLTLNDITAGYGSNDLYNANNDLIEAAIENTLSRDGSTPNQMAADIDMNSNDLSNVNRIDVTNLYLNGTAVSPGSTVETPAAGSVTITDSGSHYASDNVEDALQELGTLTALTATTAELNTLDGHGRNLINDSPTQCVCESRRRTLKQKGKCKNN